MNKELKWRIVTFFNYWRQRYEFIRDLDLQKNNHEANILVWASLDALSNLWADNIGKQQCGNGKKRFIFDAFLAHYGGEIFQIVSLPDVWDRVDRKNICMNHKTGEKLPETVYQFLGKIGDRQTSTFLEERQLRQVSDDLSLDQILAGIEEKFPEISINEIREWLTLSRYGSIAYKEMRSAYIHEGRPGNRTHGFTLCRSAIQPTYLSGIYTVPPTIGFQVEFMLGVLKHCINSFEQDALALEQDPVP